MMYTLVEKIHQMLICVPVVFSTLFLQVESSNKLLKMDLGYEALLQAVQPPFVAP